MTQLLRLIFLTFLCIVSWQTNAQIERQLLIEEFKENPIALNQNTIQRLQQFAIIDSIQAETLNALITVNQLKSFYQLQGLGCFDSTEISLLMSISWIHPNVPTFRLADITQVKNYNGTFMIRISLPIFSFQDGQLDTTSAQDYVGNQWALQQRFQLQVKEQLKITLNSAKDRGEALGFNDKQLGQDFLTASLFYTGKKTLAKLALGSYQFQWGQGLQLWTSRAMGRSIDLLQSVRIAQGLNPFTGNDEQRYLNGMACHWNVSTHEIYGFYSRKLIDVPSTQDTLALPYGWATASGLHRTKLEIQRKKQLQESMIGLAWQRKKMNFQLGSMLLFQMYAMSANTDSLGILFLKHCPSYLCSGGFHIKGNVKQSFYFLEWVQMYRPDQPFKYTNAAVFGMLFHLHTKIQLGLNCRYYGLYYTAFYEQGFHAKNTAQNEQGIFLTLTYQVRKKIKWLSFIDQYEFRKMTPKAFPQAQCLFRTQFIYAYSKTAHLQLCFQKAMGQQTGLLRMDAHVELKRQYIFNTGFQFSLSPNTPTAYSIFMAVQYQKMGLPYRFNMHLGSFMVPPASNPLYLMNYHIGYGSATLQLTGQGYFMQSSLMYQLNQNISFGLRLQWLSQNATYEQISQTYHYQNSRQNFQCDVQLKIQF